MRLWILGFIMDSSSRGRRPAGKGIPGGRHPAARVVGLLARSRSSVVGGALLVGIGLLALLAPAISPYDPIKTNQRAPLAPPSTTHPMGTDRFGRDILTRILWGGRLSLSVGVVAVGIAACAGVTLGLASGYSTSSWRFRGSCSPWRSSPRSGAASGTS